MKVIDAPLTSTGRQYKLAPDLEKQIKGRFKSFTWNVLLHCSCGMWYIFVLLIWITELIIHDYHGAHTMHTPHVFTTVLTSFLKNRKYIFFKYTTLIFDTFVNLNMLFPMVNNLKWYTLSYICNPHLNFGEKWKFSIFEGSWLYYIWLIKKSKHVFEYYYHTVITWKNFKLLGWVNKNIWGLKVGSSYKTNIFFLDSNWSGH